LLRPVLKSFTELLIAAFYEGFFTLESVKKTLQMLKLKENYALNFYKQPEDVACNELNDRKANKRKATLDFEAHCKLLVKEYFRDGRWPGFSKI